MSVQGSATRAGVTAPFRFPVYRNFWVTTTLSNLGQIGSGAAAAWTMTSLSEAPNFVALVQVFWMMPVMLLALPIGALSDIYDRRLIAITGLLITCLSITAIAIGIAWDAVSPVGLLFLCFAMGAGISLYVPAWQTTIAELVPSDILPSGIALNSLSYNLARVFGPAIVGIVLALAGGVWTFLLSALLISPLLILLLRWQRPVSARPLPPETLTQAMRVAVRYLAHTTFARVILCRTFLVSVMASSIAALMPLITKDVLQGSAATYGLLIGLFGAGTVIGAFLLPQIRSRLRDEFIAGACTMLLSLALFLLSRCHSTAIAGALLVIGGASWTVVTLTGSILTQISSPKWVSGRVLACYHASLSGGLAVGSWLWGMLATYTDLQTAVTVSALGALIVAICGAWLLPFPNLGTKQSQTDADIWEAPPVTAIALDDKSGPIIIEIEYRVDPAIGEEFRETMGQLERMRRSHGVDSWQLLQDISDPRLWYERVVCPTWVEYLRQRHRTTAPEKELMEKVESLIEGGAPSRVVRRLDRR